MLPWKSFVRSASVVTLLTVGAFGAAQDVLPFSHVSRSTSPNVEVDEPPAVEEEAPEVDPSDVIGDDTTTTTTTAPEADDEIVPEVVDVPEESTTTTTEPIPVPAVVEDPTPPATTTSAPAVAALPDDDCPGSKPKGDHNNDGHCDNGWHNKDAEWWMEKHGAVRPESTPSPSGAPAAADDETKGDHNDDGHPDNGQNGDAGKAKRTS